MCLDYTEKLNTYNSIYLKSVSVSLFQEIMISIQLPYTKRKAFLRANAEQFAGCRILTSPYEQHPSESATSRGDQIHLSPFHYHILQTSQGCFSIPRSLPNTHHTHSQETLPKGVRNALLMMEFLVWKSVLLLPSLMVPPICPGLCSGMSMTYETHPEREVRMREEQQSQADCEALKWKTTLISPQNTSKPPEEHCLDQADQQNYIG